MNEQRMEQMQARLTQALSPNHLNIIDESHKHQGHIGWKEGGETHFKLIIVSESFAGKTRVERQKLIYKILDEAHYVKNAKTLFKKAQDVTI